MFSKSLIEFSVDGWGCVPFLLFTWGQTMVEVMKIMATFKRSHTCTATLSAPNPVAGHRRPTPPLEASGHSRANLGQSLVGSLLLSPGSWCTQVLFEPSEHFWHVWGLILNMILLFLPSCWGFSFALGHGISPHSCPRVAQLHVQCLLSCWGFSALGLGVFPHSHSSTMQLLLQCWAATRTKTMEQVICIKKPLLT